MKKFLPLFLALSLFSTNAFAVDPKAKRIAIDDDGGYLSATNVEDAIQEISQDVAAINPAITVKKDTVSVGGEVHILDFGMSSGIGAGIDVTSGTPGTVSIAVDLSDLSTSTLPEGSNKYYTDARARAAISETVTGLDYDNTTGVLSATSGYFLPTTSTLSGTNTGDQTSVSGNAGTATALAANGANCSAGEYPLGVDASGAAESCTDATTEINSALAAFTGSSNLVTLGAATATSVSAGSLTATAAASGPKIFVYNTSGGGASQSLGVGSSFAYTLFPSSKVYFIGPVSDITASPSSSDAKLAVDSSTVYVGAYATANSEELIVWGDIAIGDNGTNNAQVLRFYEPSGSGSNWSAFKAQAQSGNITYTLPSADASGVLTSNGSGSLSWSAAGDVTAVGDCTTGDCFSGSSGTVLTFDHGSGTYGADGTISFDGTNNKFTISTSGITDSGSAYGPVIEFIPINTATNHPVWLQAKGLGTAGGTMRWGVDGNTIAFVAGRSGTTSGSGATGAGLAFYGTTVLPVTITNSDTASPSLNNGGIDLGSSSYRWNNVYSEAGNFNGNITMSDGSGASPEIYFYPETGDPFRIRTEYFASPVNFAGFVGFGSNDNKALSLWNTGSGRLDVWIKSNLNMGSDLGGLVNIDGQADEVQMWIQGHSTQTNNIVLIEKSDGTDLFKVNNAGATTSEIQFIVFDFTTDTATGDGKYYFHIGKKIGSANLVGVHAEVITAGTTGTTDIQIYNVDNAQDMLSTKLTIDSGETGSDTAATAAVINTSNDDVDQNDVLRVDVDAVSTTPAKGLIITLEFDPR